MTGSIRRRERPGIQSVEIASRILAALGQAGRPLPLKDVARSCAMPPAKVHRYLVSLTRTDLVTQDSVDGRYGIGPAAIALGLAGLHGVDVVRTATQALVELRDRTGETAVLAIWSKAGPVIVRIEESSRPVYMNIRVGSVLPLLRTAVGRVFAAYLPSAETAALREGERRSRRRNGAAQLAPVLAARMAKTRRHGIDIAAGDLVPGVIAIAAPVFDHRARLVASIAILGSPEHLQPSPSTAAAALLRDTARSISLRLGFSPAIGGPEPRADRPRDGQGRRPSPRRRSG